MNKMLIILLSLFLLNTHSFGQIVNNQMMFIVDSIPVLEDPEEGNELIATDLSDIVVIKNKDSLIRLGFEKWEGVTYLFTKEYRKRPDSIKKIPSTKQMERKNGIFLYHNIPYTGRFIDYYYSGRKEGEGMLLNGSLNGHRIRYMQNGKMFLERDYTEGIPNGYEIEYYPDGSLKQKGVFIKGKENGAWDMYYPNGQLKQRCYFKEGTMIGEDTVYYSTGKIMAVELSKNGKVTPDKRLEKINQAMNKGHESSKEEDYKNAKKNYSRALEYDSTYAEAYFSRGSVELNEFLFDEAIADFDKALKYEPYMSYALANRAFARIRKYQFANSRTISKNTEVTILASKDKVPIPEGEQDKICKDLTEAVFLGEKSNMIKEALSDYCNQKTNP